MRERLARKPARGRARLLAIVATLLLAGAATSAALAELPTTDDPRATLSPGLNDAGVAALGVELLGHVDKTAGFSINSDLAFEGDHAFVGSFEGFQIYDISDPASPVLRTAVVCPGGQGEVSVYGNLLFMSAE
jgi:hypothetical protein